MKKQYVKPVQAVTECDMLFPVAYSVQLGENEDDIVLGSHQRNIWRDGIEHSLWQASEECTLEEEHYNW